MRWTQPALRATGIAALLAGTLAGAAAGASAAPATARRAPAGPPAVLAARALAHSPAGPAGRVAAASPGTSGLLIDVAAAGARTALAVGAGGRAPLERHSKVLILRWNGTAWKPAAAPKLGDASALLGVTALSARDAWAVGEDRADSGGSGSGRTLILHWNGRSWQQARGPDTAARGVLNDVMAVSPRDI